MAKEWKLEPPRLRGFIQVHYRHAFETGTDGVVDNDDFRVQRVRLGVDGTVLPWIAYEIDIDPRAPEITGILRDAFISLKLPAKHRLRIGQQKMPFGYENWTSSTRLYAVNRTEVSDNLSRGVNLRDVGLALVGKVRLGDGWRFEDALAVSNGAGMNVQNDDTPKKNLWGRIALRYKTVGFWTRLGVSGASGDMVDAGDDDLDPADDFVVDFHRLGTDVEVDQDWFFVAAEFVRGWDTVDGEQEAINGYYVNLVGKTPWQIGPIARLDSVGEDYRRWTFGAYYGESKARFRVMFNYELREIFEDPTGNIGRGDDKAYIWVQAKF